MFTGYPGLEFVFPETRHTAKLVQQEGIRLGYIYTDCEPTHMVWDIDEQWIESILNQQGKAPKRIQYEVVLNAYYSNTDNAIEWMSNTYYSLNNCLVECGGDYSPLTKDIYYASACKLPTRYLPTQLSAKRYLDKVWSGESCYLGDDYWSKSNTDTIEEVVYNYVDVYTSNDVLFSNADWITGDGKMSGNYGGLPYTMLHIYKKATCCPLPKNNNTYTLMQPNAVEEDELVHDGDLLTDAQYTQLIDSVYCQLMGVALVIDGDGYITTHQLDITHYPILQPPTDGDEAVYNYIDYCSDNEVVFSNGDYISGSGRYQGSYHRIPNMIKQRCTPVLCCNLPK